VSIRSLGLFQREDIGSVATCVDTKSFVTWMMDLGRSSLDGRDLGKWDAYLGRIALFLYSGSHRHMTGALDLLRASQESDSGMYVELGMETKHVVHGFGNGILDGVKGCVASGKCVMGARSVFSTSAIKEKGYATFVPGWTVYLAQTQQWSWS
jgi:hypothetical protein